MNKYDEQKELYKEVIEKEIKKATKYDITTQGNILSVESFNSFNRCQRLLGILDDLCQ